MTPSEYGRYVKIAVWCALVQVGLICIAYWIWRLTGGS